MDLFQNKKAKNLIYSYWVFFSFLLKRDQNMEKLATSSMQPIDNSHKLHACIFSLYNMENGREIQKKRGQSFL